MQTLDQALKKLLARGDIEAEEARCAVTKEDF